VAPTVSDSPDALIGVSGSEGIAPRILNLVTRGRYVVRFMSLPLYHRKKSSSYPFKRTLGGSQNLFGPFGEKKNFLPLPGIKRFIGRPAIV
jgi:hypothetical protein